MAFVSGVVGRVTSINLAEFGAALLAYPRCMAPSDTLLVGSRPSAAGALVQASHLKAARDGSPFGRGTVCCVADPRPFRLTTI